MPLGSVLKLQARCASGHSVELPQHVLSWTVVDLNIVCPFDACSGERRRLAASQCDQCLPISNTHMNGGSLIIKRLSDAQLVLNPSVPILQV
jgi:hypothetical protein